ncbi:YdcF family protein, partial [Stenotrophomonas maltophilia]
APPEASPIETASRNPVHHRAEAQRLQDQRALHRVIGVSDPLHMARALRRSNARGSDALASSTPSPRFRSCHTS